MRHMCERIVEAAKYTDGQGMTREQLSELHHFSKQGRGVSFAAVRRYFGVNKELRENNMLFGERLVFVADQHQQRRSGFAELIARALDKWPLRAARSDD